MERTLPYSLLVQNSSPTFSGDVKSAKITEFQGGANVGLVEFAPGATTRWHRHDGDQLLIIERGRALIGNREESYELEAGESVIIEAGEEHFHACSGNEPMVHFSVLGGNQTDVLEPVELRPS